MKTTKLFGKTGTENGQSKRYLTPFLVPFLLVLSVFAYGCDDFNLTGTVTVTFNTDGGTSIPQQTITVGEKIKMPENPTKEGYTFEGWYIDKEHKIAFANGNVKGNITLYAKWIPDETTTGGTTQFTITLNANGGGFVTVTNGSGTAPVTTKTIAIASGGTVPENTGLPTKAGFTILKWNTKADGKGTDFVFGTTPVTANTVIYAQWVIAITLTLDANGGTATSTKDVTWITTSSGGDLSSKGVVTRTTASIIVGSGKFVTFPISGLPTRTGYRLTGWNTEANGSGTAFVFGTTKVTANITIFAQWTQLFTITFDANGGTEGNIASITVENGKTVTLPTSGLPTRTSYTLTAWNTKVDGTGTAFVFGTTKVTANTVIFAQWTLNTYTVTFNTGVTGLTINSVTVNHGEKVTKPADPTRANYAFGGWYKDEAVINAFNFETETITSNITLYARWGSIITLNANGGTAGSTTSITVVSGGTATLPTTGLPTRTGYTLSGWFYIVNEVETPFIFGTTVVTDDITIYAQWTLNTYTVTFKSNSGSYIPNAKVNHGEKATKPTDPIRENYAFRGWYKDANLVSAFDFANEVITANITFYAKWILPFVKISAGNDHSLALKSNGELWAWGGNVRGQIGDGTETDRNTPTKIGDGYSQISAGGGHSLALKSNGELWAWGANGKGQLGDGTTTRRHAPTKIGEGYSQISAGHIHSLALKSNGELWAWGWNEYGQLGDGTTIDRTSPTKIGDGYSQIEAGGLHSLAFKSNGELWAWGDNTYGELGDGTTTRRHAPTKIGEGYSKISAGYAYSLALKSNGELWAWGDNWSKQLGDGTTTQRNSPTKIGEGYSQISAGFIHSLALKSSGELWAWGANGKGQLGDGTATNSNIPKRIGDGYSQISAGTYHSLAFKSNGELWAWGDNTYGELGDGTMTDRTSPIKIDY
ncbi:hypothetical protein CHS0354_000615 [Potamilus streckersoni]|uniref:RCC1-like domain-containing protein n=1 Tax=Potamilus streckersoni TaxID=2493646 RepID=A0AAE0W837_9BIVA|nr:hypothetical protein CHS0354_000615 [Potamilus streckersoni]